ncbi:MAG: hypothetical protein LBI72_06740 [Flavobacteriaceae bacterium]|nr:hypothetical protein [Flavobacteriaceae bacterium]
MKTVKYILGVFILIGSIGMLRSSLISGLLTLILGLILLPPISNQLHKKFSFWSNKVIRYVTYFGILAISGLFIPKSPIDTTKEREKSIEKFAISYIENDTIDKSIRDIRELIEIGNYFGIQNTSLINIKPHLKQKYDSISKVTLVTFDPKFNFKNDVSSYLNNNNQNGILQDYLIELTINEAKEIVSRKTVITYSKSGTVEYLNDSLLPRLNSFINVKKVEDRKEIVILEKQALEQIEKHKEIKEEFEKNCLSSWDGSHRELVKLVKKNMNNPKSFEHVETRYAITGNQVGLVMVYRETNRFNTVITNSIKAKVNIEDCSIISIEE